MSGITRRTMLIAGGALAATGGAALGYPALELVLAKRAPAPVFVEDGLAIRGYDPVAYFADRRPAPGKDAHIAAWKGATWRFASAGNRDAFLADPEAFAPRYGGFCAWAVAARGQLYSTRPENWTIHEGRLYLNFNDDIQARWERDIPGFIAKAERNWPRIVAQA